MLVRILCSTAFALAAIGPNGAALAGDSDGDGVEDALDVCCDTPEGILVDDQGRPLGDLDRDCDVDLSDFAALQLNFTGVLPLCPQCFDSGECPVGEYCVKPIGYCPEPGQCRPKPTSCMPEWAPVCGCNGVSFENACYAAQAGETVEHDGPCLPPTCQTLEDCLGVGYCAKADGDCDGVGECRTPPVSCLPTVEYVCGCDGVTYENSCYAARGGASVDYAGECQAATCQSNTECAAEDYCMKDDGDCDGVGVCEPRPSGCAPSGPAICGCDGITYTDRCFSALAGISVDFEGECPQ